MNYSLMVFFALIAAAIIARRHFEEKKIREAEQFSSAVTPNKVVKKSNRVENLKSNQLDLIKNIHNTIHEVYPFSLEDTINAFQNSNNTKKKIEQWLTIKDFYLDILSRWQVSDLITKKEVFQLILQTSGIQTMDTVLKVEIRNLNKKEIEFIVINLSDRLNK
jgi:hypothetical protein